MENANDKARRIEEITRIINEKADERTKQQVRNGEISINQAYNKIMAKEIKRMPTAKEYANAAQKRHKAFMDAKAVSMEAIQQDKLDRKTLEDAAVAKVRSANRAVSRLYVQASNGELHLDVLSDQSKAIMIAAVTDAVKILETVRSMIEGK